MSLTSKEAFAKLPRRLHNFFLKYPPRPFANYVSKPSSITNSSKNPFFPNKNKETGRWHEPKYSRRRSADLFKLAYKFGISDLLPPMPRKFYQEKYDNKNWMRGVFNPKGHKWERTLEQRTKERQEAIQNMDNIIAEARPSYKKQIKKRNAKKRTWW